MWRLTLYSKTDCLLCENAKKALDIFSRECTLTLEVVDITGDPALFEKYRNDIPVLLRDGAEILRHHIGLQKLRDIRASNP